MLIRRVRVSVLPTYAYQNAVKSSYFPFKIGINPNKGSSRTLKLTRRMIIAMLVNYIIVIF